MAGTSSVQLITYKNTTVAEPVSTSANETTNHVVSVFGGSVSAVTRDHNGDLDIINDAHSKNLIPKEPMTLLHFDTHSDMFRNGPDDELACNNQSIADYINNMISDGEVDDVYWVIPDEVATKGVNPFSDNYSPDKLNSVMLGDSKDRKNVTLYMDKTDNKLAILDKEPDDYKSNPNKYRKFNFHRITIDELPDSLAKNKNIMIDVDKDYFYNSGYDTYEDAAVNYGNRLPGKLDSFAAILDAKGIKPILTTLSQSPEYCSDPEQAKIIDGFFSNVINKSKADDTLSHYTHTKDAYPVHYRIKDTGREVR